MRLDLAAAPQGRIHTLVGLNESGKTTILEAIDLFSTGAEELDARELAGRIRPNENDLVPIAQRANFNGKVRIQAGIRLDASDVEAFKKFLRKEHNFVAHSVPDEITLTDEYTYANSVYQVKKSFWPGAFASGRRGSERKNWSLVRERYGQEMWASCANLIWGRLPSIWYFPNFLFDFPARISLRPQANEGSRDRFYRALLQDVLDALDIKANVDEHLYARAVSDNQADQRAFDSLILQMGRRISQVVFAAWKEILRRDTNMRVVLRLDSELRNEAEEPFLELLIEDSDGYFTVNERPLGFRWFFVFLLLTTFRGYRRESAREMLYLLDEPASNLHPSAQEQLLHSLERVSERSRVIYTTHSQHLINPDSLEHTFVVRNAALSPTADLLEVTAAQTDITADRYRTFVTAHPDQAQYFQPVLNVLNYSPSRLEMAADLVLVEGKNDFYTLRLGEILNGASSLNLYPGDGAGSLDPVIALYIAWGATLWCCWTRTRREPNRRPATSRSSGRSSTIASI